MGSTTGGEPLSAHGSIADVLRQMPAAVTVATCLTEAGERVGAVLHGLVGLGPGSSRLLLAVPEASAAATCLRHAGRCWVSVLAEDQADVAEAFAGPAPLHAKLVAWREEAGLLAVPARSVGWIECTVAEVTTTADSFIVLAEPTASRLERDARPLVAFQGGFGGFLPTSLRAGTKAGMEEALRVARIAQEPIELVAREIGAECSVIAYADGYQVALAVANYSPTARGTQIGETFPVIPPVGVLFVGGADLSEEQWLSRIELAGEGPDPAWRELARTQLARARKRGWSIMVGGQYSPRDLDELFEATTKRPHPESRTIDLARSVRAMAKSHEPEYIDDNECHDVYVLAVPVNAADGTALVALRLIGLPPQPTGSEVRFWLSLLQQAKSTIELQL